MQESGPLEPRYAHLRQILIGHMELWSCFWAVFEVYPIFYKNKSYCRLQHQKVCKKVVFLARICRLVTNSDWTNGDLGCFWAVFEVYPPPLFFFKEFYF